MPGGAAVPTAAVTVVTVHPPYRRRGLLTAMMRHQLEQVAKRGEPLAALWASESLIYGRFGYGPATSRAVLTGTNRRLGLPPGVAVSGSVDEVTREEFLRVAPGLHESMRADRPGTMVRDRNVWEFAVFDKEFARRGSSEIRYVLHYDEAGDADGFATYRFKEHVRGGAGGRRQDQGGLGGGRRRRTPPCGATCSTSTWRAPSTGGARPSTSPCATSSPTPAPSSPRSPTTSTSASSTCRPRSRARKYAAGVDLVIELDDPLLPENSGRYRIVTDGDPAGSSAEVSRVTTAPDLSMGILELGTHLPRRRTPHRPAPRPPRHRAHPRRGGCCLDRLRLAPGALVPGHVLAKDSRRTPGGSARRYALSPITAIVTESTNPTAATGVTTGSHPSGESTSRNSCSTR